MKIRRTTMAVVAAGALVLSACTSSPEPTPEPGNTGGDTPAPGGNDGPETGGESAPPSAGDTAKPNLGEVQTQEGNIYYSVGKDEWQGYNNNLSTTNSVYNAVIVDRLQDGFNYFGTDGTVYPSPDFGTYEKTSDDPLTVEYTISDNAKWEDGTDITFNDFLLEWASNNPEVLFGKAKTDADGNPINTFNSVSADFGTYVPDGPTGEVGGKKFTVTYPKPYPDWEVMVSGVTGPAHVVAENSGMSPEELAQAILDKKGDVVKKAAKFWNEGWVSPDPGVLPDISTVPSYGPYSLDPANGAQWAAGQYLTLGPNKNYYGPPAATANLTFRFAAPETHVQGLQNGDLNVIEPQATIDTVQQIQGLGDGFTMQTGAELTYEHFDFNFAKTSPFSEKNGGLKAREAFAYCAPRQQIVDNLIKPIDPEAVVMNAREKFPNQPGYDEYVKGIYDGRYDQVDLDKAKAAFKESGLKDKTKVRIGYGAGNQRRTSEVGLIKSSCDQAGFDIIDAAGPSLGDVLSSGNWEVAMFGWAGSGTVTGGSFWYLSDGDGNFGGYKSKAVDEAWKKISTTVDEDEITKELQVVEKHAWDDLHSIPVFAFPGVIAYDADMQNVIFNSTQTQVAWNAEQWKMGK